MEPIKVGICASRSQLNQMDSFNQPNLGTYGFWYLKNWMVPFRWMAQNNWDLKLGWILSENLLQLVYFFLGFFSCKLVFLDYICKRGRKETTAAKQKKSIISIRFSTITQENSSLNHITKLTERLFSAPRAILTRLPPWHILVRLGFHAIVPYNIGLFLGPPWWALLRSYQQDPNYTIYLYTIHFF